MNQADIGLIGLAVMGENLALNMEHNGFRVAVFNRTVSKVDDFIKGRGQGKKFVGAHSLPELVNVLQKPRRIMLMVKAGKPVDEFIEALIPLLEKATLSLTAATPISPTPPAAPNTWRARTSGISAPASRVARMARCAGPRSCRAVPHPLGIRKADLSENLGKNRAG